MAVKKTGNQPKNKVAKKDRKTKRKNLCEKIMQQEVAKQSTGLGGMRGLLDALHDNGSPSQPKLKQAPPVREQIKLFQSVLQHKGFREDSFNIVGQHLRNSIEQAKQP